jgi:hypothetical protein
MSLSVQPPSNHQHRRDRIQTTDTETCKSQQIWEPTETQQESPANLNRFDNGQRIKYPMKKSITHDINQTPAAPNPTTTISTPDQHHHRPKKPSSIQHHLTITSPPNTNNTIQPKPHSKLTKTPSNKSHITSSHHPTPTNKICETTMKQKPPHPMFV